MLKFLDNQRKRKQKTIRTEGKFGVNEREPEKIN